VLLWQATRSEPTARMAINRLTAGAV